MILPSLDVSRSTVIFIPVVLTFSKVYIVDNGSTVDRILLDQC